MGTQLSRQLVVAPVQAQDPCSEKMTERMCVVMDGQESVPDFFLEIQVELRKKSFCAFVQAVY